MQQIFTIIICWVANSECAAKTDVENNTLQLVHNSDIGDDDETELTQTVTDQQVSEYVTEAKL